jgi:pimeloyl-ACP methyl ester carboxylesterase
MLVVFQRKIIYMGAVDLISRCLHCPDVHGWCVGYAPIGARAEVLDQVYCRRLGLLCQETHIESEPGVHLHGITVQRNTAPESKPETVVLYLQGKFFTLNINLRITLTLHFPTRSGNAGNPLHRLPLFKQLLRATEPQEISIVAVAPRSYWSSSTRSPSQKGLLVDYQAVLSHIAKRWDHCPNIVLYGHSLGCAVAIRLLYQIQANAEDASSHQLQGLILENPISSIPEMVRALYPSRWIPYHYLGPFAWDKWDALSAILEDQRLSQPTILRQLMDRVLIINSENDEIVPNVMGGQIFDASGRKGNRVMIPGALHDDAWTRKAWSTVMKQYFMDLHSSPQRQRVKRYARDRD